MPTEEKINLILEHASKKYVIIYKIAMECGLRPVEIGNLTADDVDLERALLLVLSAKHGNPRVLKLKTETLALLTTYIKTRKPCSRPTALLCTRDIKNAVFRKIIRRALTTHVRF